jgi:murein DD-endopeptidase MepM/ murein hydrolase activator NlpD
MVPLDTPRKRTALLFITILLFGLMASSTQAATTKKATVVKKTTTTKKTAVKKTTTPVKKPTSTKVPVAKQVKGEKVTANSISIIGDNTISTYTVKSGDTLSSIAKKFDISINTIRWSNNINSKDTIHAGQKITILPTSGVKYTVKNGDTLSGIAVKFNADQGDILNANALDNADSLKVGMALVIPNAEPATSDTISTATTVGPKENISTIPQTTVTVQSENPAVVTPVVTTPMQTTGTMVVTNPITTDTYAITLTAPTTVTSYNISANNIRGYYAQPITGRLSQGIHAVNAVDISAPVGTPVHAAADGTVIVAMGNGGYNGGYGNYMVISHSNGTQTLYAHLSRVTAVLGEIVKQGEPVALSGATGKVTGAHLHFEIRGATNPWGSDSVGTEYSI